jgi:hypothetical protein
MSVDQSREQGVLAGLVLYERERSIGVDGDVIPGGD